MFVNILPTGFEPRRSCHFFVRFPVEAQGAFAVITTGGTILVKNALLVPPAGTLIPTVNAGEGLAFGG